MNTITIPKNLAKRDNLVVMPRKEYEALLALRQIREFVPLEDIFGKPLMVEKHSAKSP
ncbi:MAG: hypothetical protein HY434_01630 [Candidatus Liptonbacteria bacterium]|nr:hypothetical protein [Candidatus Liptonbacteria bacterium]